MAKDARLELRVDPELKRRVEARALELGQKTTTFVERALEKALSDAKGSVPREQAGPGPVGSLEPVRPAASPRASVVDAVAPEPFEGKRPHQVPKVPGLVPASSLVKRGVKPIPKKGDK